MRLTDRLRAAGAAFRGKGVGMDNSDSVKHLLNFLGVDTDTRSTGALSEATYYACCKVLSESLGKLPLKLQQYTPSHGVRMAREHPYYRMLNERPNPYMSASTFWAAMEMCRTHYGNAYAWIDTRDPERPKLWPMDPESVTVYYDNARRLANAPDLYYRYSNQEGTVVLGSEEVLHFKSHCTTDGLVGVSVREQLASTIQGNIKAQRLVNSMYDNGMTAKAVLQYTGGLNDANVTTLIKGIEDYASGKMAGKGAKTIIPIPLGFTLTPLNLKLADSQFLEVKQYSALQIASAFGVKPYQVGDYTKSSYASAEAQQLSFLTDTLLFILSGYEQEIGYKLLSDVEETDGYHVKFNIGVMLRSDQKTQIETLSAAVSNFLYTPNEAREKMDLPSRDGGDQLIGNGSTIPITAVGAQWNTTQNQSTEDG